MNYNLKTDKNYGQILIEIREPYKSYKEVERIIELKGIRIIETKHLSPDYVLIKLDKADVREIILSLIEAGYSDIKGINALRY
ncbi:MAG: hypothetical protein AB1641_18305 [Thermodesulfobacteriota bacterium]